uniref:CMP/dCMP-type deaminase domain-containing protein n=1 Tax=viral metagenome TaxID=1070528 RepID=A0A6C0LJ43_9ZZZZ
MAINWNEYFMSLAILTSKRSKDPNTQVGAIIVNDKNKILSVGYNGFPKTLNCDNDDIYPWTKEEKNLFVVHAEENCILNGNIEKYGGCTMYCTLYPCHKCAQSIAQTGIRKVVYLNKKEDTPSFIASKKILENAGIIIENYIKSGKTITIEI